MRQAFDGFVVVDLRPFDPGDPEERKLQTKLMDDLVKSPMRPAYVVLDARRFEASPGDPASAVVRKWGYKLGYVTDPATWVAELDAALKAWKVLAR